MKIIINEDEKGIVFKNGVFQKLLAKGKHYYFEALGQRVEVFKLINSFTPSTGVSAIMKYEALANSLEQLQVEENEICLYFLNSVLDSVLKPGRYAFWKSTHERKFIKINTHEAEIPEGFDLGLFSNPKLGGLFIVYQVESYEVGLLVINGKFIKELSAGKYFFWHSTSRNIIMHKVDLRIKEIELLGQEIMTADRIMLRINSVTRYKIIDPKKTIFEILNHLAQLHICIQLALREFIGKEKLDNLLDKKEEIAKSVLQLVKERESELGVEFLGSGIKDIILPGEIKDILNTVLLAEKKAQANIITRREEIASTRSLLNTAKLLDENKTLYKLKELEYLEKIMEKISTIQISNNGNILEQLGNLIQKK